MEELHTSRSGLNRLFFIVLISCQLRLSLGLIIGCMNMGGRTLSLDEDIETSLQTSTLPTHTVSVFTTVEPTMTTVEPKMTENFEINPQSSVPVIVTICLLSFLFICVVAVLCMKRKCGQGRSNSPQATSCNDLIQSSFSLENTNAQKDWLYDNKAPSIHRDQSAIQPVYATVEFVSRASAIENIAQSFCPSENSVIYAELDQSKLGKVE